MPGLWKKDVLLRFSIEAGAFERSLTVLSIHSVHPVSLTVEQHHPLPLQIHPRCTIIFHRASIHFWHVVIHFRHAEYCWHPLSQSIIKAWRHVGTSKRHGEIPIDVKIPTFSEHVFDIMWVQDRCVLVVFSHFSCKTNLNWFLLMSVEMGGRKVEKKKKEKPD